MQKGEPCRVGPDGPAAATPQLFQRLDDIFGYLAKDFTDGAASHRFPICIGELGSAFVPSLPTMQGTSPVGEPSPHHAAALPDPCHS